MDRLRTCLVVLMAGATALGGCVETGAPDRVEITSADDTAGAGVPIRLVGPGGAALVVPVRINGGGPFDFILDTGATFTCVDRALADSLELPEARGQLGTGMGIQGDAGSMRLVEIDSLAVGDVRAEGLTGCALDLSQLGSMGVEVRGLLGLNFLRSFRMTLDFDAERLILAPPSG